MRAADTNPNGGHIPAHRGDTPPHHTPLQGRYTHTANPNAHPLQTLNNRPPFKIQPHRRTLPIGKHPPTARKTPKKKNKKHKKIKQGVWNNKPGTLPNGKPPPEQHFTLKTKYRTIPKRGPFRKSQSLLT